MNCIFCKNPSDNSKSVEHIIPESLGNEDHVLPPGIVCDTCNNYFSIKIEKDLLEQNYFKSIRHRNDIESKKGKNVPETGLIVHPEGGKISIYKEEPGIMSIDINDEKILNLIKNEKVNKLYIPIQQEPENNNVLLSKFIGKVAIEALTLWLMKIEGWETEITYKEELDPLRNYVRFGSGKIKYWEYHQRRVYSELDRFVDTKEPVGPFEILHEFTFHYSDKLELFFIMAIMGIEYAINMGGPEIETYTEELKKNNYKSFLEVDYEQKITNNNSWLY